VFLCSGISAFDYCRTRFLYALVDLTTDHGNEITVPNLSKLTEEQVEEKLDELDLDYVLLDSVNYKSDFPKFSVAAGSIAGRKVKVGRKVSKLTVLDFHQ
jgi:beta-lactam-binding protein with PASTA domain